MLEIANFDGAILDVDDTMLSNSPDETGAGLHEHSRLAAGRQFGMRYGNQVLLDMNLAQCAEDFHTSPVHSIHGAVWNTLVRAGMIQPGQVNPDHPLVTEFV